MVYNRSIFAKGAVTYSDIDLSFKANPMTGDVRKKQDAESIKQSLKTLLFTNQGERPFQPNLYGGLNDLLFEPLDSITTDILKDQIRIVIGNNEPRISIIDIEIIENPSDNSLEITLKFNMQNVLGPQTISLIISRTR